MRWLAKRTGFDGKSRIHVAVTIIRCWWLKDLLEALLGGRSMLRGGVLPSKSGWRLAERNLFREILRKSLQVTKPKGFTKLFDVCIGRLMTGAGLTHFHAS